MSHGQGVFTLGLISKSQTQMESTQEALPFYLQLFLSNEDTKIQEFAQILISKHIVLFAKKTFQILNQEDFLGNLSQESQFKVKWIFTPPLDMFMILISTILKISQILFLEN